jgi:DUF1009 family protein
VELARAARRRGRAVSAIAIEGLSDPALDGEADSLAWLRLGELEPLLASFRETGVQEVVLAGKVPKTLLAQAGELRLDARAQALLRGLADRSDDSILGALAALLEGEGFRLLEQLALAPELAAPEGTLGRLPASEAQLRDVAFGWPVAKALGALDVGQTVVVQDRAVLALEAIEGTDAAIRRGCSLGRPGACVVKVAKPRQDPRFDVPAVGPETLHAMAEGGAGLLAVEARATLVLERERLVAEADARGIAVIGVSREGPAEEEER